MGVDGRDVQAGLAVRMIYQRQMGGFLLFPVCGVWFNLQDFAFSTYSVAFFVRMLS
jgi:hypothetical protein